MPVPLKASFWFLICSFLQKGISVITTPIFTRLLTPAEFGQYNVFYSYLGIVSIFVSFNLAAGVYAQGLVKFEADRPVFSSSMQGLSATIALLWTVIYAVGYEYWNDAFGLTTVQMLAMLVMIWTSSVFNFWAAEQRVLFRYQALVFLSLGVSVVKPAVGILCVILAEDKVTARILSLMLVELVAYTGLFVIQERNGKQFFSKYYWKYAILFNLPLIPHYLSQTVLNSADRIMIERMINADSAGIYSLGYSLAQLMILFNSALMQTITPWFYKKIKDARIQEIAPIAYLSLICIAIVNLVLIAFAPEAVAIFAPIEYRDAIWIIPPVAMSVYFLFSYDLFAKFAFYYEKTSFIMFASIGGAILNVVLNYIFINIFGYIAAAYTTLLCYMIYCGIHYYFMNKVCRQFCDGVYPYSFARIMLITILFLSIGSILLISYQNTYIRFGIILVLLIVAGIKRKQIARMLQDLIAIR